MNHQVQTVSARGDAQDPAQHEASHQPVVDSRRSWYVLVLLTLSFSLAYIDRQLLNLLVDPIKHSLQISDTQLSFILGAAFISAYLVAAPLFGRLVDISHRRNILLIGVCTWCVFTALCGCATTYAELFIARFGVGASEACVIPVGWSLISDYFSARRAPRALSIFMLGPLLGGGFSLVAGSMVIGFAGDIRLHIPALGQLPAWQLAFIMVGTAGFLLAALLLTVQEPVRRQLLKATADERHFTVREAGAFLWQRRAFYVRFYVGVGMLGIVLLGMPAWLPAFLIRYHGLSPAVLGYRFGLLVIVFGSAGVLTGPWVARILQRRGYEDAALRVIAASLTALAICCAAFPLMPDAGGAFIFIAAAFFFASLPTGMFAAALQIGTPSRMRGAVASLYTFFGQLIGLGIGPTAIAVVTDQVFRDPKMVGHSVGIVCFIASLIAALLFVSALPAYRRTLEEERGNGR